MVMAKKDAATLAKKGRDPKTPLKGKERQDGQKITK